MAAKKKKNRTHGEEQDNVAVETARHLSVQPPDAEHHAPVLATESHAPVLARPRKKNKKNSGSSDDWTIISSAGQDFGEEVNARPLSFDSASTGSGESRSGGAKKFVKRTRFEDDGPVDYEAEIEKNFPVKAPTNSVTTDSGSAPTDIPTAPVDSADPDPTSEVGDDTTIKESGKHINPERQKALEEVRQFKRKVLERAATWTFPNDTPFTPSPYPNDLYLCDKPDNTLDDNAMLELKRAFDAAVEQRDPTLIPAKDSIPLHLAKRAAMYVHGILKAHDGQFRCAIDSLRAPPTKGEEPLALWVADTWDERLADSDRDWLLGKAIEEMEEESAQRHVGGMMEFVLKYQVWGKMVESECEEMMVGVFPRLG